MDKVWHLHIKTPLIVHTVQFIIFETMYPENFIELKKLRLRHFYWEDFKSFLLIDRKDTKKKDECVFSDAWWDFC